VSQALLFPDPKPLVMRLGVDFFRQLPRCPGVYLMRDARENVLYVGKAKNLRQRLYSYRVANPDRLGRRHLRLLRQVARIEWRLCRDETAALAQEAELLRSIRPKFNRAGVWPVKSRTLLWRWNGSELCLKVGEGSTDEIEAGWRCVGPVKGARWLRLTLARVLWLAVNRETGVRNLPAGWHQGRIDTKAAIPCGELRDEVAVLMGSLNNIGIEPLVQWVRQRVGETLPPFEAVWLDAELESLDGFRLDRIGQPSPTLQVTDEQRRFAFA
jgi:predicted GIY-YIG superfamily endonuclease